METEQIPIEDLHPYERNARTHTPEQVDQVAASITEFGWTNPVIIDGSNGIIAGHGRVLAAKKLGMADVPTIRLRDLTDAQKRAYIIADNQLALNAGWDQEILQTELIAIADMGFDLSIIGFEGNELDEMLGDRTPEGTTDEDEVPDAPITPTTQPGDVWILGDHILICGDSTKPETFEELMQGDQAHTIWTDPPYNVDYNNNKGEGIANANMADDAFKQFLLDAFCAAAAVTEDGRGIYIAHSGAQVVTFRTAAVEAGFEFKQDLVWVKSHFVLGRQDYQWQHEPILYGCKPGKTHCWFGEYDKTTVIDDDTDLTQLDKDALLEILNELREQSTIIRIAKPGKNLLHPTMKPIELITRMIKCTARQGEIVLDPFGGSGSTLIACEKTRRHARLIELDPRFCDVIVHRWQDYTGKQAYLDDGTWFEAAADARS